MDFYVDEVKDIKIIRLNIERLDSNQAPELKAQLLLLINEFKNKILLDLNKVKYTDSSGLGALLFGARYARENNGTLKLIGVQQRVASLIRIAHLESVLVCYESEDEAVSSFGDDE